MSRWLWHLSRLRRTLWVKAALISLLAIAAALISIWAGPYLPDDLSTEVGAEAVDQILAIIASSMLAVTTFSLSTMVSAYSSATGNVTPRATRLLLQDSTTQNVLATFVGAFLYSLVAIITLSMGAYGDRGRVVLFVMTLIVVTLIIVTLVRWIDYLRTFGRVGETTAQVEKAATAAMVARARDPYLAGLPALDAIPPGWVPVHPAGTGYVQHVAVDELDLFATETGNVVHVVALPGAFADPSQPIAWMEGTTDAEAATAAIRGSFTIGDERTFDQDPRFGVIVLSEIASRALSPAVNDPGTAIDVIGRLVRVLSVWADAEPPAPGRSERVRVPPVALGDVFDDAFTPVARDGAAIVEVGLRLQKALAALAQRPDMRYRIEAARHARLALQRAEAGLTLDDDLRRVREAAAWATG